MGKTMINAFKNGESLPCTKSIKNALYSALLIDNR